jgi:hypothetical protein
VRGRTNQAIPRDQTFLGHDSVLDGGGHLVPCAAIAEGVHGYRENSDRPSSDKISATGSPPVQTSNAKRQAPPSLIHHSRRVSRLRPPSHPSVALQKRSACRAVSQITPVPTAIILLLRLPLGICRETEKHERRNSQGTHVIAPFEPTNLAMNKQQALALPIPISINEIVKADFKKLITP